VTDRDTPFLTAEWRHLMMLNFEIDPTVLAPRVPPGTELDTWRGRVLLTLVGFRFLETWVRGFGLPGHRDFEEVNLRFYVRRRLAPGQWRRGVVFVREIVPRRLIAIIARSWFGEPYVRHPMRHEVDLHAIAAGGSFTVRYAWRHRGRWLGFAGRAHGAPAVFAPGSEVEFVTEHYWGYTARPPGTDEYRVDHAPWRVWPLDDASVDGDVGTYYGPDFAKALRGPPCSAFLAEGSAVAVYPGHPLLPDDPAPDAA
jgi:hypothetical protein